MSANLKKPLAQLSSRGPHRVLTGDLAYAGLDGTVYTPAEGNGLPAVAFAHDWTKKAKNYHATCRHLASWGIVVAVPNTETGFIPNHSSFATDLRSALQIVAGVKLGQGNVTVSPKKLGLVGHGMGGGAAVLAAANNSTIKALAALFPSDVSPSSYAAARNVKAPGLIIDADTNELFGSGNPAKLAYNYAGPTVYRTVDKINQQGFSEDGLFSFSLGFGFPKAAGRETVRGLVTGFLLHQLGGEKKYADFSDPDAEAKHVTSLSGDALADEAGDFRDKLTSLFS